MFRVGLYARVSTNDQQIIPLQIRAFAGICRPTGLDDRVGNRFRRIGPIVAAACRRDIDVVLVWRLDRWGRSVADLLTARQELDHLGVGFVSLTEAAVDPVVLPRMSRILN